MTRILSNFIKVDADFNLKVEVLVRIHFFIPFLKSFKIGLFHFRSFPPDTVLSTQRGAKWLYCPCFLPSLHQFWHFSIALALCHTRECAKLIPAPGNGDGSMMCWYCIASIIFEYIFWLEICSIKSGMEILPLGHKDAWGWDMGFCWNIIIVSYSTPFPLP